MSRSEEVAVIRGRVVLSLSPPRAAELAAVLARAGNHSNPWLQDMARPLLDAAEPSASRFDPGATLPRRELEHEGHRQGRGPARSLPTILLAPDATPRLGSSSTRAARSNPAPRVVDEASLVHQAARSAASVSEAAVVAAAERTAAAASAARAARSAAVSEAAEAVADAAVLVNLELVCAAEAVRAVAVAAAAALLERTDARATAEKGLR